MASPQSAKPILTIALVGSAVPGTWSYSFQSRLPSNSPRIVSQSLRDAVPETSEIPTQRRLPLAALFSLGTPSGGGFP